MISREISASADADAAIDEALDSFECEWAGGHPPSIAAFYRKYGEHLRPYDRRRLLIELAAVDLWRRWGLSAPGGSLTESLVGGGDLPARPALEDYVRHYPDLGSLADLPAFLAREEYRARLTHGGDVRAHDYRRRFPNRPEVYAELDLLEQEFANASTDRKAVIEQSTQRMPSFARTAWCPNCRMPLSDSANLDGELSCPSCGAFVRVVREAPSDADVGRCINQFELVERLGSGGFGTVWRARDTKLQRDVAIKIPRRGDLDANETALFLREARSAAQLRHPHIVAVHEVGLDGDRPYIVSELVRGAPLSQRLQSYSPRQAAELCAEIAESLHHAHEAGVVHRDLKPANVMIDPAGRPHLLDFGLARRVGVEATLSEQGQILGTPAYMSPEQASGANETTDRRTDVYSLGVILFQLLTGELPFRGNAHMMMMQIINYDAPSPRELVGALPRDLETICLKCLEKKPGSRYATADALADDLRRYLRGAPIQARPIGRLERAWKFCRANPMAASLVAASVTFLSVLSAVLAMWNVESTRNIASRDLARGEAIDVFRTVVFDFQAALELMPRTAEVRQAMLNRVLRATERLAQSDDRLEADDHATIATHLALGEVYLNLGRGEHAIEEFRQGVQRAEAFAAANPSDSQSGRDLGAALMAMGEGLEQSGNAAAAREYYLRAERTFASLTPPPADSLCGVYIRLAQLSFELQDIPSAGQYVARAVSLCDQHEWWRDPAHADEVRDTLNHRGDLHLVRNDLDAAEADYRAALALAPKAPHQALGHRERDELASISERLATAIIRRLGPDDVVDEANELYQSALAIRRQLVEQDPQRVDYKRRLAYLEDRVGEMWLALLRPADATTHFEVALNLRQTLIDAANGSDRFGVEQLSTYGYLARAADVQAEFAAAIGYCSAGLVLWEKLNDGDKLAKQPRLLQLRQYLMEREKHFQLKLRAANGDDAGLAAHPELAAELLVARAIAQGREGNFEAADQAAQHLRNVAYGDPRVIDLAARTYAQLAQFAAERADDAEARFVDASLSLLEEAHQAKMYWQPASVAYLEYCAAFDSIRSHRRFEALRNEVEAQISDDADHRTATLPPNGDSVPTVIFATRISATTKGNAVGGPR
jgi:tetratricopeptide (TPR) repeat protein